MGSRHQIHKKEGLADKQISDILIQMEHMPDIADCVCVVLRSDSGKYYLAERSRTKDQRGVKAFPGGDGTPGTHPREDAARELFEETDLDLNKDRFHFIERLGPLPRETKNGTGFYYSHIYYVQLEPNETPSHKEPHKMDPWVAYEPKTLLKEPPHAFLPGTQLGIKRTEAITRFLQRQKERNQNALTH